MLDPDDVDTSDVAELLAELAERFGPALNKVRVFVAYRDQTWVLELPPDPDQPEGR